MDHKRKIATIQKQIDAVDSDGDIADLEYWRAQNDVALRTTLGVDNPTYKKLADVSFTPLAFFSDSPDSVFDSARRSGIKQTVALMKAAIGEIELLAPAETAQGETAAPGGTRVFIVHGHDDVRKLEVATLVRDLAGVKPTILSEYPNQGDTIIEKFERAAAEAAFAIIIASSDDLGTAKSTPDELAPRPRQNVIFELGFFIGKLGRSRVALLVESGIERPSDTDGIVYIPLDPNGAWKLPLAKELNRAGVATDIRALLD
ncbi:TIR domain-containing protein [Nocardia harenae]|uniref:TIR domain-containing protein n=1 Tax=Nocardia harenae TaxID=358707 RepID=UPI00082F215D|nr:nucleotide-binding protein [Nocardia harenae]